MQVSRTTKRRSPAKLQRSKSKEYLVDLSHYGPEPRLLMAPAQVDFIRAFNWYSYMVDAKGAREFLEEFLEKAGRVGQLELLGKVPDVRLPLTAAWIARMITNGVDVPQQFVETMNRGLFAAFDSIPDKFIVSEEEVPQKPRDRTAEKLSDLIGEIEGLIDDEAYNDSFFEWLQKNSVPVAFVPAIIAKYQPVLEELVAALKGTEQQVIEAYSFAAKKSKMFRAEFLVRVIQDSRKYADSKRTARRPRKPRVVSVDKKIARLKFQATSTEFKMSSISPERIIGAKELWMLDARYKLVTVLRAPAGLDIKGTAVTGFDAEKSETRRLGRGNGKLLESLLTMGKSGLKTVMDRMGSRMDLRARCTDHTLLLRAVK